MEGGPPVFPPGFTCPAVLWIQLAELCFRVRDSHTLWLTFPCHSTSLIQYRSLSEPLRYYYLRFGLFRVRSPYLDVSVQAVSLIQLLVARLLYDDRAYPVGFPHSEIHGSMTVFVYPWLIADYYVLLRLLVPRHSPCALCSLTIFNHNWFLIVF